MLKAVLFDWGDTLMGYRDVVTQEFALDRTRVGLAALERQGLPDPAAIGHWFETRGGELFARGSDDEADWLAILAACFGELGSNLSDDDVRLYAKASLWEAEMTVEADVHAVLNSLRDQSLRLAIVSNTALPFWLLEGVFERQGLSERMDTIVLSSEVGKRKPHPAIFERALEELKVAPEEALFVGDRLYEDVRGAAELGMTTVQALWFRADENPDGREPDFRAFTQADVLNVVRRLNGEGRVVDETRV